MFVHHLGHRIAQQNDLLIERLDLPLKLDTVDEINRHRHVLFAQGIQKRVLQKLPFIAHDILRVQELMDSNLTT